MSTLLIIDTNYPINSRTLRFENSLSRHFDTVISAWRRDNEPLPDDPEHKYAILSTETGYGNRLRKLRHMGKFLRHTLATAKRHRPELIFASHWDSLVCAVFIKRFVNKEIRIVYDCLDLPTSENRLLRRVLRMAEQFLLRHVAVTVFASRFFKSLYKPELTSYVFENYPSRTILNAQQQTPAWLAEHSTRLGAEARTISWIGVVRYFEILENILQAIQGTDICFLVFGDGPDLPRLKQRTQALDLNDQVIFFGAYKMPELSHIYAASNLVWAAYPTRDFNAVYAISNKYFECSHFCRRPILSRDTMMARDLSQRPASAILVDEYDVDDIRRKVNTALADTGGPYHKYEPDTFWEDEDQTFIAFLQKNT